MTEGPVVPSWDTETGLLRYWPAIEGEAHRQAWITAEVAPTLVARGGRHGLLIGEYPRWVPSPGSEASAGLVQVALLVSDRPFEALQPDYVPSVSSRFGLPLGAAGPAPPESSEIRWDWWLGHGERALTWRVPLLVPLFAACMPPPDDDDGADDAPAPVALARLTHDRSAVGVYPVWQLHRPWLDGVRVLGDDDVKMTTAQAAAGRAAYLQRRVLPVVSQQFAEMPVLRSAVLMVAQYYDDNADDEVHLQLVWSELDRPDTTTECARYQNLGRPGRPADPVNLPSVDALTFRDDLWPGPDDGDPVPLFAAYCVEGADQNDEDLTHWRPYAVFRRSGNGITVDTVGLLARPWLDGERLF